MSPARLIPRALLTIALCTGTVGLTALNACGDSQDAKHAKIPNGPMPEGESWTGVYFHPVYGYLHMVEEGSNVVGRWKRADQSKWGELSGTKNGNVMHYTWKEHTVGMV